MTQLLEEAIKQIKQLPETEQDIIARLILNALENNLAEKNLSVIDESHTWTEEDQLDITSFSLQYAASIFPESDEITQ
ncbi:hypothetical protein VB638_14005 [Dolichospermum sp. UHCC 0684]|jgi:hypothetical protein|uniref:hypothetical protein n=1 Tax=unclassified Dolichospermum TaxID=2622029 RepID=UPI0014457F50|nr:MULTISPECIES: hypothetical protein [unclassified Dolichospermum]MEA5530680.1 hypothetical protein [Dolichospermum sp. UHCC 0684]MTJ35419.1 hypothetical protein [Dolichospermum sp. UHCC 0260]